MRALRFILSSLWLASTGSTAHAVTYMAQVNLCSTSCSAPVSQTSSDPLSLRLDQGGSSAIAQASPLAGGTAYSLAKGVGVLGGFSRAQLYYDFRLAGPNLPAGQGVPIFVVANGYANTSGGLAGGAHSGAQFRFGKNDCCDPFGATILAFANSSLGKGDQTFSVAKTVLMLPNEWYQVSLLTQAQAGGASNGVGTAEAFADPQFTIDAAFASQYTFEGLIGAAVPEPATWASMIAGFALVGGAMRRRAGRSPAGSPLAA